MQNGEGVFSIFEELSQKFEYTKIQESKLQFVKIKQPITTYNNETISEILILNSIEINTNNTYYKVRRLSFLFDKFSLSPFISDTKRNFGIQYTYSNPTSFLIEANKQYSVSNLSSITLETPWVEGVEGYGIGEGFTVNFKLNSAFFGNCIRCHNCKSCIIASVR